MNPSMGVLVEEGVQIEDVVVFDLDTRGNDGPARQGGETSCQKLLVHGKLHFYPEFVAEQVFCMF